MVWEPFTSPLEVASWGDDLTAVAQISEKEGVRYGTAARISQQEQNFLKSVSVIKYKFTHRF